MQTELLRIRIPAALKETLRQRAIEDGRSMNGQLVQILKAHLGHRNSKQAGTKPGGGDGPH